MRDVIAQERVEAAHRLSGTISDLIDEEIKDIETYADEDIWETLISERNLMYKDMNEEEIDQYFSVKDRSWIEAPDDNLLIKECLENDSSIRLKAIRTRERYIINISITDIKGGLIASSNRTYDFYQGDEKWWQEAYNNGKGKIFIGDIGFYKSSGTWFIPISVPIRNEKADMTGVCKADLKVDVFFAPLSRVRLGRTGHALLVNGDNNLRAYKGVPIVQAKLCSAEDARKMLNNKKEWGLCNAMDIHNERLFLTFAQINNPFILERKMKWYVLIVQDAAEVFKPLRIALIHEGMVIVILILLIIPLGYLFGNIFTRPIEELHVATEKIMVGDWDYKVNIKTGDEIEDFSDIFSKMVEEMKNRQEELTRAKVALEQLTSDLEKRVVQRTEELSQSKNRLEEALKVKSDFTSMVSHELRTPLTAIKDGIGIVADGTAGPLTKEQKEFLEVAGRNVDRLGRLINDILDFQKLDAGIIEFDIQENSINEAAEEACATMSAMAKDKKLDLILDLDENLPALKFDWDKIVQVFVNLIQNAIKFTETGGVTIRTRQEGNMANVSIEDTGPGIKKEDMFRLFQRFSQLESGFERKTGGSGLGLAISKEIIERHKGKIWAEPKTGGSIFHFILPIVEKKG